MSKPTVAIRHTNYPIKKSGQRYTIPSKQVFIASVSSSSHDRFIANPFSVQCINHAAGCKGSPLTLLCRFQEGCWKFCLIVRKLSLRSLHSFTFLEWCTFVHTCWIEKQGTNLNLWRPSLLCKLSIVLTKFKGPFVETAYSTVDIDIFMSLSISPSYSHGLSLNYIPLAELHKVGF